MIFTSATSPQVRPIGPVVPNSRSAQATGLVFWAPFSMASNSQLYDVISGARTSSISGWTTVLTDQGLAANSQGVGALLYPGFSRVLTGVTVSVWFRPSWDRLSGGGGDYCCAFGPSTSSSVYLVRSSDLSTYDQWYLYDTSSGNYVYASTNSYSAGDLIHIVAVYYGDGTTSGTIYQNGTALSVVSTTGALTQNALLVSLAADITLTAPATIDLLDVRLYSRALTPNECVSLYDPATRWQLYEPAPRLWIPGIVATSGTVYTITPSGAVTPTGVIVRAPNKLHAGLVTPAGTLTRQDQKSVTGSITPTSALVRSGLKLLAGTVTPAGAIARSTSKTIIGLVTPTGILNRALSKFIVFVGNITPTGTVANQNQKVTSGSITPTGAFTKIIIVVKIIAGSITPTGTFTKAFSATRTLFGSIVPTGTLQKDTSLIRVGVITPTGALAKSFAKQVVGSVTPGGSTSSIKVAVKVLVGVITPTGTLVKSFAKQIVGNVVPSGALLKGVARFFDGSITPIGQVGRFFNVTFLGMVTPTGLVTRGVAKKIAGSIIPVGTLIRTTLKRIIGLILPSGSATVVSDSQPPPVVSLPTTQYTWFVEESPAIWACDQVTSTWLVEDEPNTWSM